MPQPLLIRGSPPPSPSCAISLPLPFWISPFCGIPGIPGIPTDDIDETQPAIAASERRGTRSPLPSRTAAPNRYLMPDLAHNVVEQVV